RLARPRGEVGTPVLHVSFPTLGHASLSLSPLRRLNHSARLRTLVRPSRLERRDQYGAPHHVNFTPVARSRPSRARSIGGEPENGPASPPRATGKGDGPDRIVVPASAPNQKCTGVSIATRAPTRRSRSPNGTPGQKKKKPTAAA